MRLIDVLNMMANGEIKKGTILNIKIDETSQRQYKYIYNAFIDDYSYPLDIYGEKYLNQEVTLINSESKKYHLKLDIDDESYVSFSENGFIGKNYSFCTKGETSVFKTKFTQEEIDNNKFLKFVEKHGIKEEVEENEND